MPEGGKQSERSRSNPHDSSNGRYRADYVRAVMATAKKYGAATIYWDNGHTGQSGFGLIDRRSLAVTQQGIIDAIMTGIDGGGGSPSQPAGAGNTVVWNTGEIARACPCLAT